MRPIYIIEMLVLAAFWGLSFYFMRVSSHEFGPVTLIFLRTLSAACLTPVFLYKQLLAESIKHYDTCLWLACSIAPFHLLI